MFTRVSDLRRGASAALVLLTMFATPFVTAAQAMNLKDLTYHGVNALYI